jgi:hypothetical protein
LNQLLVVTAILLTFPAAQRGPQPGLRIIVIQGEDAVNILQQKTAVAPIVEVRDQNDLPVGGAIVTFSISGGQAAFAGGAPQITVTTNAAGRAAASALNPLQAGPVRIQVQAAFQGQTATTTIAQTNAATAAEAAARAAEKVQGGQGASGGTGAATGATTAGAAGASGGGLSGAAIAGIVGGVAAGAGLGLKAASGGGDDGGSNGTGGGGTSTPCRFTLSQTSVSTNSLPSSTTITVTAEPANCSNPSWTATASSASNFFLLSNNSAVQTGTGSGSFSVNIPENRSGGQRTGTVTFAPAGLTVPVTQAANCNFTVSPTSFGTIQAIGGTNQVAVMLANSPCDPQNWTASVNTPGAVTINPTSGSGSGLVNVTFLPQGPNTSGSRPVSITVAGQVVSGTQLATTPAAACQAQAMRGSDVGETRRIDFGQTSGSFLLKYDTGDRSDDRVVVLYEGRTLFDSGCVSTGGPQMRALNFSGNSSAVSVQVMPNCRGGWGSSWSIEVACQ